MLFPKFFNKQSFPNDFPYYRKVWMRIVLALLAASLIPLFVIGGGVANYAFQKIESHTLDALHMQVQAHQQAIDRFLGELENQLKLIATLYPLEDLIAPGRLEFIFNVLQQHMSGLSDIGVIDNQGYHRAYVGSHALSAQTYDQQDWFRQIAGQESYISDVYLGHRQIPHFIIAVRGGQGDNAFFVRATVDGNRFDHLVRAGPGELSADSFIVNRDGLFQTRSHSGAELMASSGIEPNPDKQGVHMAANGDVLDLMLWQQQAPWLSVIRVSRAQVYGAVERARQAVLITFMVGALLITATVLLTTGSLVTRLENKGQDLRMLDQQLHRTSYLAAVMESSQGFTDELRDVLSNIDMASQNLTHRDLTLCWADAGEPLRQMAMEASRGHKLLDRFTAFMDIQDPIVSEVNINELLDDLLALLHQRLAQRCITIVREYQIPLATLRSDNGKLRQVFLHLLLNAASQKADGGRIRLVTQAAGDHIIVTVSLDGAGTNTQPPEQSSEPLSLTRPAGIFLNLSICRALLHQLGGTLTQERRPDQGATLTVKIPARISLPS